MAIKDTAQLFKGLGDEKRLRIMSLLVAGDELCVCDIMAALKLPQSTVSRHLSYLRNSGLLRDRRQGVWMYYTVNLDDIDQAHELMDLLALLLGGLEQVEEDRLALSEHLATKGSAACSGA